MLCPLTQNKINTQDEGASPKSKGIEENILGGEDSGGWSCLHLFPLKFEIVKDPQGFGENAF